MPKDWKNCSTKETLRDCLHLTNAKSKIFFDVFLFNFSSFFFFASSLILFAVILAFAWCEETLTYTTIFCIQWLNFKTKISFQHFSPKNLNIWLEMFQAVAHWSSARSPTRIITNRTLHRKALAEKGVLPMNTPPIYLNFDNCILPVK